MKKSGAILSIFLIIVSICVIAVGAIHGNKNEKMHTALAQQHRDEAKNKESRISSLNFYGNLLEGRDVDALIIGDSIGQSAGSSNSDKKWSNLIIKDVMKKYKSTMTTDFITGGSATGIRGWVELNSVKATKKYDLAFICFGQNDQFNMKPEQFKIFYESIIINLKKINPNIEIIPIIESSFREYNDYSKAIEELSKHYNLQYADTLQAFNSSAQPYSNLTKDAEIPSDKGYNYYARTIEKIIDKNYASKKKTKDKYSVLYNNTNKLTDFVFDNSPDLKNGFTLDKDMTSSKVSDSLTFNTTNSVAIIHFLRQPSGGKFKVFIDDNFVEEIDTKSTFQVSYSKLIADNLEGKHKIRIEISSIKKGEAVKILGLATN